MALDYGEGTCLQVWIWKEKNGQPKAHGLSVLLETGAGERFVLEFVRPASARWSGGLRPMPLETNYGRSRETSEAQSRRARQQSFRHSWLNRRRKGRTPGGRWPDIIWPVRAPGPRCQQIRMAVRRALSTLRGWSQRHGPHPHRPVCCLRPATGIILVPAENIEQIVIAPADPSQPHGRSSSWIFRSIESMASPL